MLRKVCGGLSRLLLRPYTLKGFTKLRFSRGPAGCRLGKVLSESLRRLGYRDRSPVVNGAPGPESSE
jgi:hypothetical protein